jgi:hypothetical protein
MSAACFETSALEELAQLIERRMNPEDPAPLLGEALTGLARRIPSAAQVTPGAVVRLALLNDALRVAERALQTDAKVTDAEVAYVEPLVREAQKYLGRFRNVYSETSVRDRQGVLQFLEHHSSDGQKFGGRCTTTQWIGLDICKRSVELSQDLQPLQRYRDLLVRMLDDLFGDIGSGSQQEKQQIVDEIVRLVPVLPTVDRRALAYCSPSSPEVFHAVAHAGEIFVRDPFDVERIHSQAREAFMRLVDRADEARFGKMLLIKGDAGSGKTHLMRAMRNVVHAMGLGFVAYVQMSTNATNYARYLLSKVIDSWDKPFCEPDIQTLGLTCLSDATVGRLSSSAVKELRDEDISGTELDELVNRFADQLLSQAAFVGIHVDVLRMMLYLQRREPARRSRVLKLLRCEKLSPYDQSFLGGVSGFEGDEGPALMLSELGRLISATGGGAFVVLVDQLEDLYNLQESAARFRLVTDTLRLITDQVPTSVVVLACLDDFYQELRKALARPVLERLEHDPEPIQLTAKRSLDEIEEMIELRLEHLFESQGLSPTQEDRLYPFRKEQIEAQVNQRTRDVLDWFRRHHEASIQAGAIVDAPAVHVAPAVPDVPSPLAFDFDKALSDLQAEVGPVDDDEGTRMQLFAQSLDAAFAEHDSTTKPRCRTLGERLEVAFGARRVLIGLCDKSARGGGLGGQVEALAVAAEQGAAVPLCLRSSEFPPDGKSVVSQKLKGLLKLGGQLAVVADADWRRLATLQAFAKRYSGQAGFADWSKGTRPLWGIGAVRALLDLAHWAPTSRAPSQGSGEHRLATTVTSGTQLDLLGVTAGTPLTANASPATTAQSPTLLNLGNTRGLSPHPVLIAPDQFTTHAAFLGSTMSGKTTLALNVLEQLALTGVPVLMLDRKGDLCTYALERFWGAPSVPELSERQAQLRRALDVRVFTPGDPRGRALALAVVPSGLDVLPAHERGILAKYAATALGAMMGYKKAKTDETKLGILGKAIELVGSQIGSPASGDGLAQLVNVLDNEDPDLVAAVGKLDTRHFHALVENIETLRLRYDHLLKQEGEKLSPEQLFGLDGGTPGKTRMTVVSTKFLGDNAAIDFWVARLLAELGRWASRHPSGKLQAVVFLDEADIYLPAQTKPATKEPMLDLLKRARSAGIGVFLATQSPGDLDYRCRDNIRSWFVGRVAEKTAIDKMKPLLSDCRVNVSGKLGQAKTGEFWKLQDGNAIEFKAGQSVMKTTQLSEEEIIVAAQQR